MPDDQKLELSPEQLRWTCEPTQLPFESVEELPATQGIIGQDRALEAIRLGVTIRSKGHNVYVAGPSGSGRATTVRHLLHTLDTGRPAPPDLVYVHNFKETDHPIALLLPNGQGCRFAKEMEEFVGAMRRGIIQIYESEDYKKRRAEILDRFQNLEKESVREFDTKVHAEHFALVQVQMGPFTRPEVVPLIAGEPRAIEQLEELAGQGKFPQEELSRLKARYAELRASMETTWKRGRELRRQLKDELAKLEQESGRPLVTDLLSDIEDSFTDPKIARFLAEVREVVLSGLSRFVDKETEDGEDPPRMTLQEDERYRPFLVNVLVDNTDMKRAPVVVETSPNYRNLFGTIEKVVDRTGHWRSDFLHIKSGSLLRANGGFLILDLIDVAAEPGVWPALKRALRNQQIDIQSFDPMYLFSTSALKPEPVKIDVRVIVLGDDFTYQTLWAYDPDFRKVFKVKADFDTVMPRSPESIARYAGFMRNVCAEESLHFPTNTGAAAVIEHGARLSGQGGKLSTRFSDLADLLRESSYWADRLGANRVTRELVERALEERERRHRFPEEKMQELIEDGTIRIETEGKIVGQVNGLSVFDLGDHRFGKPIRITAQTSLGQGGLLSIEREAELSGRSFNKAMLIIEGFFRARFGQEYPMSVTASIAFEQSYGEVDGDSASIAEIVALVSSLAELPVRQELAVTGSADQVGNAQPIGGVNEKIEGFFDVSRARGLSGGHGVIIPRQNVPDLMLRHDLIDAVERGIFHIYAIDSVEQAVALLLDTRIGQRAEDGLYEENSIFGRVQDKLHFYAERMREFGKPPDGPEGAHPGEGAHGTPDPSIPQPDPNPPAPDRTPPSPDRNPPSPDRTPPAPDPPVPDPRA